MAMTRTIPCKANLGEVIHFPSFSNKQQEADSSTVQVVVDPEASHSISQVVAIESRVIPFRSCHLCIRYSCIITYCMFGVVYPILTFQRSKKDCILTFEIVFEW